MKSLRARMVVNSTKFLGAVGAVLFASAGTVRFWQAWVYLGLHLTWLSLTGAYFLKRDPALVERRQIQDERGEREPRQRRIIATLRALGVLTLVIAGLDHRFGWSSVPTWLGAAACALFTAGTVVVFVVFRENTHTSSIIEVEAGQTVVVTGPYRVLRHPMYAGTLLMGLATPVILGSYWALVLLPPGWALLVTRIFAEERFLSRELRGYAEYLERTRRRLVPGLW